jgi:hypothetical protein
MLLLLCLLIERSLWCTLQCGASTFSHLNISRREQAAHRAQSLIVAQGHSAAKITPKVQSGVEIVS